MKAWKVAQTLMEIWSGVAGAARALVASARAARPDVVVACTRKNVPGTKALAIAAIKAGGAAPHRLGLSETILVFPQHRVFRPNVAFSTLATELRGEAPEKKLVVEVGSVGEAIAAAEAGFDVVQTEKFDPQEVEETARAFAALSRRPVLAAAGGIHPENAAAYALAGADVLVTSWPYTARPTDVAVTMGAL
jgi:molybdenum transport protein